MSLHQFDALHGKGAGNQSASRVTRVGLRPGRVGKLCGVEVEA